MKQTKSSFAFFLLVLTLLFSTPALAVHGEILNAAWETGRNSLTLDQGEDAVIDLEILSAGYNVELRVDLQDARGNHLRYLEEGFTIYHRSLWTDQLNKH